MVPQTRIGIDGPPRLSCYKYHGGRNSFQPHNSRTHGRERHQTGGGGEKTQGTSARTVPHTHLAKTTSPTTPATRARHAQTRVQTPPRQTGAVAKITSKHAGTPREHRQRPSPATLNYHAPTPRTPRTPHNPPLRAGRGGDPGAHGMRATWPAPTEAPPPEPPQAAHPHGACLTSF